MNIVVNLKNKTFFPMLIINEISINLVQGGSRRTQNSSVGCATDDNII